MNLRVTFLWLGILLAVSANPEPSPRARPTPIYSNQFAIHVPDGSEAAAAIAEKHGFDYHGQVSYYIFLFYFIDLIRFVFSPCIPFSGFYISECQCLMYNQSCDCF